MSNFKAVQKTENYKPKRVWWGMTCVAGGLQTTQTERSFTLLIIIHGFNPKSNTSNQEKERTLVFCWKASPMFCQYRLFMSGTRRVITATYGSSSVEICREPITERNGSCIHRATKVVVSLACSLTWKLCEEVPSSPSPHSASAWRRRPGQDADWTAGTRSRPASTTHRPVG